MYGATVDWRIQGTASAEVYTFDYEGDFRIYKNDILTSSLPTDANDWVKENASYRVVIDKADGTTLASAAVDAPDSVVAYATVDEDSIEFKLNKTMLVGTTILYNESTNTAGIAPTDFVAVEGTWTPNGTAEAPKVTEIIVDYDEVEVADGTNNIKLKVSYVGDDGTEKEITIPYSFEGVGYITSEGFTLTVNEETLSNNGNLKSNWERWDVSDFVVSSYQKVGTVEDPQITAITVNNTPVDLSSDFELAPGATVTFEITYVGSAGSKTTSTLSLTVVGA